MSLVLLLHKPYNYLFLLLHSIKIRSTENRGKIINAHKSWFGPDSDPIASDG